MSLARTAPCHAHQILHLAETVADFGQWYQRPPTNPVWYGMVMVFIYSTSLYIIYIAHHYNITQDAEREMHEVQYLYVAFP